MRFAGLLAFIPQELIPLLVLAGGFCLVIGLRPLAATLFTFCGILIVLPVFLEALLSELPDWALYPIMLFAVLSSMALLISLLIGRNAWEEAKGHMAANVITWLFLFPFRLIRWFFTGIFFGRR